MDKVIKKSDIDMTSGNLFKKIFIVAFPFMMTGVLQLFYTAADLIVCGQFGSEHAVAAISATNSLVQLIINLFLGMSTGAAVLMSRCYGSNDEEKGRKVLHTSFAISLIIGFAIGLFGALMSRTFLIWMGTPNDIIDLSSTYLIIYFCGLPFTMLYNFGSAILRSTGDTKHPFFYLLIAGIFNILLNLFLVIVCKIDVAGVAIATITSQAISSILIILRLRKGQNFCKLEIKNIKIYKDILFEIFKIGLPAGIQGCLFSLSNVVIQSSINSFGAITLDGNGSSHSIEGFIYTCMNSIAQTCVSFVSANYGAKKVNNIKKSVLYSIILVTIVGVSMGLFVTIFGKSLLNIYLDNPESIDIGYQRLSMIALTYFTCGIMDVLAQTIRGLGYSSLPTIVVLCGVCGLRIIWVYTAFNLEYFHNYIGILFSYPLSWGVTSLILFILYSILKNKIFKKLENSIIVESSLEKNELVK